MGLVLAVEDDRLSQRLVEKIYRNAGHDVLLSGSVQGALELLRRHVFVDLVILDSHLGREVGWNFVTEIRRLPLFRQLPVVVYTGYTERQEVLRYAALKVQAVHVKPFKADVLLNELDRVARQPAGLRSDLWEPAETVCDRLKIGAPEYGLLLLNAAAQLEEDRVVLRQRLQEPRGPGVTSILERLKQRAREIGVRRMDELADAVAELLRRRESSAAEDVVEAAGTLIQLVRQRGQALLGTSTPPVAPHADAPPGSTATKPPTTAAGVVDSSLQPSAPLWQQVVHRPFWALAGCLGRLPGLGWSAERWQEEMEPQLTTEPALQSWLEGLRLIDRAGRLDLPETAQLLASVPGFEAGWARIVQRTTMGEGGDAETANPLEAVARLGIIPAAVLAALAGVMRSPVQSPLDLAPLRRHAAASAWLALELGRLFQLREPQEAAAGALARHFGLWCLAVVEPGLSALALSGQHEGIAPEKAVERWFGAAPDAIGARLLLRHGLASAAAVGLGTAAASPAEEPTRQAARTLAHLASELALAAFDASPNALAEQQQRLADPAFPAWVTLRAQGLPLPRDVREFAEATIALARTSRWVIEQTAS